MNLAKYLKHNQTMDTLVTNKVKVNVKKFSILLINYEPHIISYQVVSIQKLHSKLILSKSEKLY